MFGLKNAKTKIETAALEARAEAVFNVLNAHKVFGNVEGKWLECERRGFNNMVTSHAVGERNHNYLELTYDFSCVRLIIHTNIFAGEAYIREITAYDHPWKNDEMDYEALNRDIHEALNEFKAW